MKITAIGGEVKIGTGAFERSSVAWTNDGRLVVAADMGEKPILWFGEEPVRGAAFTMRELVDGMAKNPIYANRCFLPRVVVDAEGYVWVSFKTGTKELDAKGATGTTRGVALAEVVDGDQPEVILALADVGHGQAEPMPGRAGAMVLGTLGKWALFDQTLSKLGSGTFGAAGASGEKIQFRIGYKALKKEVVWHTCHNGYSKQSSRYACTGMAGVTWADFSTYRAQGSDTNHPGLGVDAKKPGRAVMGSVFDGALRVNVALNGTLEYPANSLPSLGEATLETRFGPQFVKIPTKGGGMLCLWNKKGTIRLAHVEASLAATDTAVDV